MESKIGSFNRSVDITKRSRHFVSLPEESAWSIPFLDTGGGATSSIRNESDKGIWRVFPQPIPMKAVGIWMYLCCLVIFPLIIYLIPGTSNESRWMGFGVCAMGALMVIPIMLAILNFMNKSVGTEDYLRLDEKKGTLELPRLQLSFVADQVCQVVSIGLDESVQVLLLVDETGGRGGWSLYHVCNICDSRHWLGRKLAKQLGKECQCFQYTAREIRELRRNAGKGR